MKSFGFKIPAFVCAVVYLVIAGTAIWDMLAATSRNFQILTMISAVLGAVLFLVCGVLVREETPPVVWVMVGFGNMAISIFPYLLLGLLLSPVVLLTLPVEAWKDSLQPMLLSLYPFAVALWRKAVQRRVNAPPLQRKVHGRT